MSGLAELLAGLVRIDSVNPSLVPGGAGEAEIASFVAGWLREHGVEASVEPTAVAGRPNVVARVRGTAGAPTLMLNAHMDTVGVAGMDEPFSGRIEGGRLYGRGSADTKAGLAAAMWTLASARDLRGELVLCAVSDEEWGSVGTEAVVRTMKADAAIVLEPTGMAIATCHRGFVAIEVEVEGRAAHGSLPHEGLDAIAKSGRFLTALDRHSQALLEREPHPLLGPPSVHASLIEGGQEWSSYPERCVIKIERRTLPGESVEDVVSETRELVAEVATQDALFRAHVRAHFARDPLDSAPSADFIAVVTDAFDTQPTIAGAPYWTDAALLSAAGIPSVVLGPYGEGIHGTREWVDLAFVEECARVLAAVARGFCSHVP